MASAFLLLLFCPQQGAPGKSGKVEVFVLSSVFAT
jgi:hypothetical protein